MGHDFDAVQASKPNLALVIETHRQVLVMLAQLGMTPEPNTVGAEKMWKQLLARAAARDLMSLAPGEVSTPEHREAAVARLQEQLRNNQTAGAAQLNQALLSMATS